MAELTNEQKKALALAAARARTQGEQTATPQTAPPIPEPMASFGQQPQQSPLSDPASYLRQSLQGIDISGQDFAKQMDDSVRSLASGGTAGLADEFAAGANTLTGLGPGENYTQNLEAERATDAEIDPSVRFGGELMGAVMSGSLLARGGLTLMNAARPTVAGMAARGAGEGALYGAAYGFGSGEGEEDRMLRSLFGAGTGALTGMAGGALIGGMGKTPVAPTSEALKQQANAAYTAVDNSGMRITPNSVQTFADDLATTLQREGIDPILHPAATRALERIATTGDDVSFQTMDILRKIAKDASASQNASERRLGQIIIENIDDFVSNLQPGDIIGGADPIATTQTLRLARDLWSRGSKSELVQDIIQTARDRVGNQYSASGLDNAIRSEFRKILTNPRRMRLLTSEEQQMIRDVARGGPLRTSLQWLGKFAPTGNISSVLGGGAGAAFGSAVGGPIGAGIGGIAVPAVGGTARFAGNRMAVAAANRAGDAFATGGGLLSRPPVSIQGLLAGRTAGQLGGLLGSSIPEDGQ